MTRPTLQVGDLWSAQLANAAGLPRLDGADAYGSGPLVIDDWLSDDPSMIKPQFTSWRDRLKVTPASGLTVSYPSSAVMLANGTTVSIAAGTITLPASASSFVYVSADGVVTSSPALPTEGIPLAFALTDSNSVVTLSDIRYQSIGQVRPLATGNGGLNIGDIKYSENPNGGTGWVPCDRSLYVSATYPEAAAIIGRRHSLPGDVVGTFRVPDYQNRVAVGVDSGFGIGSYAGSNTITLTTAQLPSHSHPVIDNGHIHQISGLQHSHPIADTGHTHPVLGSLTGSDRSSDSIISDAAAIAGTVDDTYGYGVVNNTGAQLLASQSSGVSVRESTPNAKIGRGPTGITLSPTGRGDAIDARQASVSTYVYIRLF